MAYGTVKVDNITFDNGGSDQNVTVSGLYRATTSGVTLSGTIAAATVSGVTIIGSTTVSGATVTGTTANFTSGNFGNIISSAATMSGALIIANQQQVQFREAVGNGVNYIALQAPAIISADQTITLPDQTGTVVTTGDDGSVTSTMILDGTILNVDINASAAIAGTKISPDFGSQTIVTTGVHSAAVGSATTPSIAFTGDLNTGIYSPGADQVAISTNGTGRLFVDASGDVGLGTSDPVNYTNYQTFTLNATNGGIIHFKNTANTNVGEIALTPSEFYIKIATGAQPITFGTNNTERMRLTAAGLLGLGISSPGASLHVNNITALSSVPAIGSLGGLFNSTVGLSDYGLISGALNSGAYFFQSQTTNGTSATYPILLNPNGGAVGIGTTSPGYALDVAASDTTAGIGYASRIRANATAGAGALQFTDSGVTTQYGVLIFGANGVGTLQADGASSRLVFSTNSTERARIDSSGRLLVGTSSSVGYGSLLQVVGGDTARPQIHRNVNDQYPPIIYFSKARGTASQSVSSGDELGQIAFVGYDGTGQVVAASIDGLVDGTPGASDMPGRLVFSVTADGAASPTEALRISNDRSITVSDGGNVVLGTTTGTKIGTGTTQKIGFYNATPVVQPTAVADATDAATVITQLNALLTRMRNLGLIAT